MAFWSNSTKTLSTYELYVINANGSGLVRLTPNEWTGFSFDRPSWSPDGSRIVFTAGTSSLSFEVYIINVNDSNLTRLTHDAMRKEGVVWSPDGKRIAYISWPDKVSEIYIMNSDGSNQIRLTNSSDIYNGTPIWSPDSTRIAFICGKGDAIRSDNICIMNADGSNLTQIHLPYVGVQIYDHLAWSPNGKQMLIECWCRNRNSSSPEFGVYTMNVDGSNPIPLSDTGVSAFEPVWSPNGQQIAFLTLDSDSAGGTVIYIVNIV